VSGANQFNLVQVTGEEGPFTEALDLPGRSPVPGAPRLHLQVARPLMRHRNQIGTAIKTESPACSGNSCLLAMRCRVYRRRDSNPGFRAELENLVGSVKGKGASGQTARPKVLTGQSGADCSIVAAKQGNAVEQRRQVIGIEVVRVNGKPGTRWS
jgi:hypothetical protein